MGLHNNLGLGGFVGLGRFRRRETEGPNDPSPIPMTVPSPNAASTQPSPATTAPYRSGRSHMPLKQPEDINAPIKVLRNTSVQWNGPLQSSHLRFPQDSPQYWDHMRQGVPFDPTNLLSPGAQSRAVPRLSILGQLEKGSVASVQRHQMKAWEKPYIPILGKPLPEFKAKIHQVYANRIRNLLEREKDQPDPCNPGTLIPDSGSRARLHTEGLNALKANHQQLVAHLPKVPNGFFTPREDVRQGIVEFNDYGNELHRIGDPKSNTPAGQVFQRGETDMLVKNKSNDPNLPDLEVVKKGYNPGTTTGVAETLEKLLQTDQCHHSHLFDPQNLHNPDVTPSELIVMKSPPDAPHPLFVSYPSCSDYREDAHFRLLRDFDPSLSEKASFLRYGDRNFEFGPLENGGRGFGFKEAILTPESAERARRQNGNVPTDRYSPYAFHPQGRRVTDAEAARRQAEARVGGWKRFTMVLKRFIVGPEDIKPNFTYQGTGPRAADLQHPERYMQATPSNPGTIKPVP